MRMTTLPAIVTLALATAAMGQSVDTAEWTRVRNSGGMIIPDGDGDIAAPPAAEHRVSFRWITDNAAAERGSMVQLTLWSNAIGNDWHCDAYPSDVVCDGLGSAVSVSCTPGGGECAAFRAPPDCSDSACGEPGVAIDAVATFDPAAIEKSPYFDAHAEKLRYVRAIEGDVWTLLDEMSGIGGDMFYWRDDRLAIAAWWDTSSWLLAPPEGRAVFTVEFKVRPDAPLGETVISFGDIDGHSPTAFYDEINGGQNIVSPIWGDATITIVEAGTVEPGDTTIEEDLIALCDKLNK